MPETPDLWEVRTLPGGLTLELWGGGNPALVLAQGKRRGVVDLPHVKEVVAALVDGAADLVTVGLLFLIDCLCPAKKEP